MSLAVFIAGTLYGAVVTYSARHLTPRQQCSAFLRLAVLPMTALAIIAG